MLRGHVDRATVAKFPQIRLLRHNGIVSGWPVTRSESAPNPDDSAGTRLIPGHYGRPAHCSQLQKTLFVAPSFLVFRLAEHFHPYAGNRHKDVIILAVCSNRVSRPHREGCNHLVRLGIHYCHRIGTEVDSFVSTVEPYLIAAYSLDRSQSAPSFHIQDDTAARYEALAREQG